MKIYFKWALLLQIVFSLAGNAKIKFEQGYFINNQGVKIECLIKNTDWRNNPSNFLHKLSEKGDINFHPVRFETEFKNWMTKADAWCISRQLWWGHQIPAWYKKADILKENPIVSSDSPGVDYVQDDDVLDTWFSSALWPIIMTGNHENKPNDSLPTSLLVTGYDLIFFWISKMIFMSTELKGKVPFSDVLIHGLIRDKNGKKMSKSLGNGVDPMEVIDKYGNDSLRWFLLSGSAPGNDLRFDDKKLIDSNNFINKWYNVAKFATTLASEKDIRELSIKDIKLDNKIDIQTYQKISQLESKIEKWLLEESSNKYNISLLAREVYDFYWNVFANKYLELSKYSSDWKPFVFAFKKLNQMLSPFLPFVCEEIYQSIFKTKKDDSVFLYKDFSDKEKFSKIAKDKSISKIDIFKLIDFWSADIDKVMNFTKFHVKDVSFEINWNDKKSSEILSKYISKKKSTVFADNTNNSLIWQSMDDGTIKLFSIDKKEVNNSINSEINAFLFNKYENELKRSEKIINNKMIKANKPDLYNLELSKYNYFKMLLNK
ncbi:MAG: class I tRNA ligase family protein [Mycoplasmataceae bacterium]|nr:class I tRNA ligase family protein [Mycoplasmataceae bacterium]